MYDCLFIKYININTNLIKHKSVNGSPSLLNQYLWYDNLWGPSQRVVTLFFAFNSARRKIIPGSSFSKDYNDFSYASK